MIPTAQIAGIFPWNARLDMIYFHIYSKVVANIDLCIRASTYSMDLEYILYTIIPSLQKDQLRTVGGGNRMTHGMHEKVNSDLGD